LTGIIYPYNITSIHRSSLYNPFIFDLFTMAPESSESTVTFKERSGLVVPRIDKLDDKNYRRWSTLVLDAFEALGIGYTIKDQDGDSGVVNLGAKPDVESPPVVDSALKITHPTKSDAEIKADNASAVFMIKSLCNSNNFDLIADSRSAYGAWKILERAHKGQGNAHLMGLIRQFYSRKWNQNDTIDGISAELNTLQQQIGDISSENKPPELHKTFRLLESLRGDKALATQIDIYMSTEVTPPYESVLNRLREQKQFHAAGASPERGNTARTNSNGSGGTQSNRKGRGSKSKDKNQACKHCQKKGHRDDMCFIWLATEEGRAHLQRKSKELKDKDLESSGSTEKAHVAKISGIETAC
jgi:hypothetical protein